LLLGHGVVLFREQAHVVKAANSLGDRDARREFRQRQREEQQHLQFVGSVVERYALRELQDEPAPVTLLVAAAHCHNRPPCRSNSKQFCGIA
jgi:hypothetical protein